MWLVVFCIDPAMNWGRVQDGEATFAPRQLGWTPAPSMSQSAGETVGHFNTDDTQASEMATNAYHFHSGCLLNNTGHLRNSVQVMFWNAEPWKVVEIYSRFPGPRVLPN